MHFPPSWVLPPPHQLTAPHCLHALQTLSVSRPSTLRRTSSSAYFISQQRTPPVDCAAVPAVRTVRWQ